MIEFTKAPITSTEPLTKEMGMAIYALIKSEGTVMKVIEKSLYDISNILAVSAEAERILTMRGQTEIVTPAVYDEELNLVTEAVYAPVEVTSEILDVATILADFPLSE